MQVMFCTKQIIQRQFNTLSRFATFTSRIKQLKMYSTEAEKAVIVEKVGIITTIGINRPEVRNCVNLETGELLKLAIEAFENDESSPVAVLYGKGGNFCAGYDLSELSKFDVAGVPKLFDPNGGYMGPTHRLIKKPLIAAISGYAVAGGLELALMCDLRVVEETAIMGVFCRRFGVPLIDGGTVRLQALIGLSRALDLILTGRAIEAKEAFECGLANRLVACGTALGQALNLATSIAKFPQKCLNADRISTYRSAFDSKSLEDSLKFERENGIPIIFEESVSGAQKFKSGIGKHGKFYNLSDRKVPDWEDSDKTTDLKHKL